MSKFLGKGDMISKVTILLSTYNGSEFLQEQLDSLYKQTYSNITILVRDDGSIDSTVSILETEQQKGHLSLLQKNINLGPALSFFELLKYAALTDTEYIAFCDQDDVWLPEKVERAIAGLSKFKNNTPAMYCTKVELVDESLNHLYFSDSPKKIGFGNSLVENIATGCTVVLNRKAINLLCKNLPSEPQMHDWWCYIVISCFGVVVFDPTPTIKYRQHNNNTIGVATNSITRLYRKFCRFFGAKRQRHWCSEQAAILLSVYSNEAMSTTNKLITDKIIVAKSSLSCRLSLVFSQEIWRQKWSDNLILRILILINRI